MTSHFICIKKDVTIVEKIGDKDYSIQQGSNYNDHEIPTGLTYGPRLALPQGRETRNNVL